MKRLRFAAVLVMICAVCLSVLTSCSGDVYKLDSVEVSDIKVVWLDNKNFDLRLNVNNRSSETKTFDMSKFTLKLNDSDLVEHFAGKEDCPSGESSFSFMIDNEHPEMSVGDSITVYFDDKKVCDLKITELK